MVLVAAATSDDNYCVHDNADDNNDDYYDNGNFDADDWDDNMDDGDDVNAFSNDDMMMISMRKNVFGMMIMIYDDYDDIMMIIKNKDMQMTTNDGASDDAATAVCTALFVRKCSSFFIRRYTFRL